ASAAAATAYAASETAQATSSGARRARARRTSSAARRSETRAAAKATTAFMVPRSVGASLAASVRRIRCRSRVRCRSMRHRVALVGFAAIVIALAALSPVTAATPKLPVPPDYAAQAWSILPPGENGSLAFDAHTTDQAKMYDALTLLRGSVTQRD